MNQVLEFYPSTHGCIQGCFHCPRGVQIPSTQVVQDITNRQRELARNTLFCFGEQENGQNALNLSGYVGEYGFQLFDDIGGMSLDQVYFNLGLLDENSLRVINENVGRVGEIIKLNTGDRNIDIFGNIQNVDGGKLSGNTQMLQQFVSSFFQALKSGIPFSNKRFTGLMIASNNMSERNLRDFNILELLNSFVTAHSALGDGSISVANFKDFTDEGVSLVRSDKVIDDRQTRIDFRGICAKKSKKTTFLEELKVSLGEEELTISIFPDVIMVYHSTWNMHIKELFFSYDEFEQILKDYVGQTGAQRFSLKRIIDERLAERAHNLGLI